MRSTKHNKKWIEYCIILHVYLLCLYTRIQDICYIWYVVAYGKHVDRFIIAYCTYVIRIYTCNLLVQQVIIYVRCGKV
jgi:hypothetical protein